MGMPRELQRKTGAGRSRRRAGLVRQQDFDDDACRRAGQGKRWVAAMAGVECAAGKIGDAGNQQLRIIVVEHHVPIQ